jgi:predicted transcriptional regulator
MAKKDSQIFIRAPQEFVDQLRKVATQRDLSMSWIIRNAVEEKYDLKNAAAAESEPQAA